MGALSLSCRMSEHDIAILEAELYHLSLAGGHIGLYAAMGRQGSDRRYKCLLSTCNDVHLISQHATRN